MSEEEKKAINNMELFARVHQNMAVVTAKEMDTVLKLVERLQKENEELKIKEFQLHLATEEMKSMIYKQKVKDKIEKLKEEYEYLAEENQRVNKFEIELLQELLEGRK